MVSTSSASLSSTATENQVFYKSSSAMTELGPSSVDLVVTSPPYFYVKNYAQNGHNGATEPGDYAAIRKYPDYIAAMLDSWNECYRVLKPNGKLIINAPMMPMPKREMSTHHNRDIFNIYADIEHSILGNVSGIYLMDLYVWNRTNSTKKLMFGSYPYPRNLYAQNTIEFIGVFVKEGKPAKISQSAKFASTLSEDEWVEYTKQIWNIPVPNKSDVAWGKHPAIMPEEIARRCIRMYSYASDVVLDPFAGSGTTLKVAKELGRKFVGYELYEHYQPIIDQKIALADKRRCTDAHDK